MIELRLVKDRRGGQIVPLRQFNQSQGFCRVKKPRCHQVSLVSLIATDTVAIDATSCDEK